MATTEVAGRTIVAAPRPAGALTQQLLHGPIVPTLLRLAAPNVVVIAVQAVVSAAEAMYVGWLGAEALAGVALVFPLIMLMQTMSAGGMGGGVASAVARAVGAGRRPEAEALAWHAGVIALVMGAVFTLGFLWGGPVLYAAMGGTGNVLTVAVAYSRIVFSGAIAFWLFNLLAAVVRGTGNMRLPALVVLGGAAHHADRLARADSRLGTVPPPGRGRRRLGDGGLLRARHGRAARASRLRARARPSVARSAAASHPIVLGHPPRRRARCAQHHPDEPDDRDPHRPGGALREPRAGRLRCRRATRVSADSAGLRSRLGAGHHGRHQHRCRTARPRAPHHVVRGGRRDRADR